MRQKLITDNLEFELDLEGNLEFIKKKDNKSIYKDIFREHYSFTLLWKPVLLSFI